MARFVTRHQIRANSPSYSSWVNDALPILVQHGSRDNLIQVERARQAVASLRQERMPLTYREYDIGHEINAQSLADLSAWLQEKVL